MTAQQFHPDLRLAGRLLPRAVVSTRTLPAVRTAYRLLSLVRPRDVSVVHVSPHARVRVFRPPGAQRPGPALLWVHGGGYVIGRAQQDDRTCRQFARQLGILVASVDYRLAPEFPYPAALDDCTAALRWLAADPGVNPARIAVGGASAGAGLATALALRIREHDTPNLAFQLLAYPMLDDRTTTRRDLDTLKVRTWSPQANQLGWRSYLAPLSPGADDVPALAAPARAQDLTGLPPTWIGVGSQDLFHDEDCEYARRLSAAGVVCRLDVVPEAFHGFDILAPRAQVSRAFVATQHAVLAEGLETRGTG